MIVTARSASNEVKVLAVLPEGRASIPLACFATLAKFVEGEELMKQLRIRHVLGIGVLLSGMFIPSALAGTGDPAAG